MTARVLDRFRAAAAPSYPHPVVAVHELTSREREVLELMARGLTNPEIARALVTPGAS